MTVPRNRETVEISYDVPHCRSVARHVSILGGCGKAARGFPEPRHDADGKVLDPAPTCPEGQSISFS